MFIHGPNGLNFFEETNENQGSNLGSQVFFIKNQILFFKVKTFSPTGNAWHLSYYFINLLFHKL